jgi:phosphofructokinase-like protein
MRIGVLTGGGDSPAINSALRAIVRRAEAGGHEVLGFAEGWRGVVENRSRPLKRADLRGSLHEGGTILGTSRTNPHKIEGAMDKVQATLRENAIDALITIGGDDTNGVARRLDEAGLVKAVGIPQTIDNDIPGTEWAIGFDSALNIVVESIDRLRTTARSHQRVIVVEIMGRDAGWLALLGGLAGGADEVLIPERQFDVAEVCERIKARRERGQPYSIIAIAEGARPHSGAEQVISSTSVDAFGHAQLGGVGHVLAQQIEKLTGFETRSTNLGHLPRGGAPTAFDRVLGTLYGVKAVELLEAGTTGVMVVWQASELRAVPFAEALERTRLVPDDFIRIADMFR